ncbi:pseudouridine synthase [Candidatus Vidania fulgoroideorum]
MNKYNNFFIFKKIKKIFIKYKKFYKTIFLFIKKKIVYIKKSKKIINYIIIKKNYLIIDKKKNYLVYNHTLKNIKNILSCVYNFLGEKIFDTYKCGIVQRLDFNTSGLIIISRNNISYNLFKKLFKKRKIKKYYFVICNKYSKEKVVSIKNYIYKKNVYKKKKNINFKYSSLKSKIIFKNNFNNIVICKMFTGRKNQIKIQFKNFFNLDYKKIFLHSYKIKIKKFKMDCYSLLNKKLINLIKNNNTKTFL